MRFISVSERLEYVAEAEKMLEHRIFLLRSNNQWHDRNRR